jgi:DNA (cytosine-5)-methyltransferase 1
MKFGSVCSGIEAASVAWHKLGWTASWLAEIEPFPSAVLAHHYPDVPNLGDMTLLPNKILSGEIEAPDIFCGGTPCQAFSIAGNRNSLDDARGNLSLTFCEIANAIDSVRTVPSIIFWENVPGVLNTKDNAFGCFLAGLAGEDGELKPAGKKWSNSGCVFGPKRTVAWRTLDAQYFGLAQRRKRVFVVASARDGFDPTAVLFECEGVRRDSPPSRHSRETTSTNAQSGFGTGRDSGLMATLCAADNDKWGSNQWVNEGKAIINTKPLNTMTILGRPSDDLKPRMGSGIGKESDPSPTLTKAHSHAVAYGIAENIINRQDHNGPDGDIGQTELQYTLNAFGTHAIAAYNITFCDANGTRKDRPDGGLYVNETDMSNTLTNGGVGTNVVQAGAIGIQSTLIGRKPENGPNGDGYNEEISFTQTKTDIHAVAYAVAQNQSGEVRVGDVFNTLTTNSSPSARNTPMLLQEPVTFKDVSNCLNPDQPQVWRVYGTDGIAPTTQAGESRGNAILTTMAVRRLTPTECERLQGFPDDYTKIPWKNKQADDCPDGPRYKALGNSWAVPVVTWIGKRICKELLK